MDAFLQSLANVPPGIDPEVLSEINALFLQSPQQGAPSRTDDAHSVSGMVEDTEMGSVNAVAVSPEKDTKSQPSPEEGKDEGIWEESEPSKLHPPRIVARYSYPSESRPMQKKRPRPLPAPPRLAPQPSLFSRIISYIGSYFDPEAAIIEYTDKEIAQQSQVSIEVQQVENHSSSEDKKVIRVVALVANGVEENGEMKAAPIEIKARHKRVRDIMKDHGASDCTDSDQKLKTDGIVVRITAMPLKPQTTGIRTPNAVTSLKVSTNRANRSKSYDGRISESCLVTRTTWPMPRWTTHRDYEPCFLDIALSIDPEDIVSHRVLPAMLFDFCGAKYIKKYISRRSNGSTLLILPASHCEHQGIRLIIRWMQTAYSCKTHNIVPAEFIEEFVDLCCAERALLVLNLQEEAESIRLRLEPLLLSEPTFAVFELKAVWKTLPRYSYWAEKVLDHIKLRLEKVIRMEKKHRDKVCCDTCGVRVLEDPYGHTDPSCLVAWMLSDETLRKAFGNYKNGRGPHLHTEFAEDGPPSTVRGIQEWILEVEDTKPYPFGQFPSEDRLIGDVKRKTPVFKDPGSIQEGYRLQWLDKGGYYIETVRKQHLATFTDRDIEPTEISRQWLISRGYRGGGDDGQPVQSPLYIREGGDRVRFAFRDGPLHEPKPIRPWETHLIVRRPWVFEDAAPQSPEESSDDEAECTTI
ncbi:uncharacterized protein K460DRAFT_394643 [Cucurbitaria berberidis CBS 394.84]|uniref:Uncharacterized protein n=1 Tax=Cucurbitaria berberidis CBS 394.84 TaxID=1168544 RepID=A0A9P4GGB7_9PLEO|nr:uncharacterized protein K460DRAFT_394643 [Cucurbitaria berberidis CBS 394.84]KAF1844842.1 hypothetical protein K460DRAFT_394643 [Cucurbitaria berberidis CBS 394.84]